MNTNKNDELQDLLYTEFFTKKTEMNFAEFCNFTKMAGTEAEEMFGAYVSEIPNWKFWIEVQNSCIARGECYYDSLKVESMFNFYTSPETLKLINAAEGCTDVCELDMLATTFVKNCSNFMSSYIDKDSRIEYFKTTDDAGAVRSTLANAFYLAYTQHMHDTGVYEYADIN